ncbi:MAG: AAA-like domain-containing protein, partial [Woeseiaceae bacterium]
LQSVSERIVIFVDEITCLEELPFADQLLGSIRAAHNARTTDPDFLRLTFVLLGECDPASLIAEPEMSPFIVAQQVVLDDFTREQINLFATELGLDKRLAEKALDRIYYWTKGQPYLTQKLARYVSRTWLTFTVPSSMTGNVPRLC